MLELTELAVILVYYRVESCFFFLTILNMLPFCIHFLRFSSKFLKEILENCPRRLVPRKLFFVMSYNYNIDYTRWSPYTTCNVTCGNGTKSRFRVCIDDDPAVCIYNQKYFEYADCNEGDCPGLLYVPASKK